MESETRPYGQFDQLTELVVRSFPIPFESYLYDIYGPFDSDSLLTPQQTVALRKGIVDPSNLDDFRITEASLPSFQQSVEFEIDRRRLDFFNTDRKLKDGLVQATKLIGMPSIFKVLNPLLYTNSFRYRWRPDGSHFERLFPTDNGESKKKAISGAMSLLIKEFRKHELSKNQSYIHALDQLHGGINVVRLDDYLDFPSLTPIIFDNAYGFAGDCLLVYGAKNDQKVSFKPDKVPLFVEANVAYEVRDTVRKLLSNQLYLPMFFSKMRKHHLERLGITIK